MFHILCLSCLCCVPLTVSLQLCLHSSLLCRTAVLWLKFCDSVHEQQVLQTPSPSPTPSSAGQGREEAACEVKARKSPIIVMGKQSPLGEKKVDLLSIKTDLSSQNDNKNCNATFCPRNSSSFLHPSVPGWAAVESTTTTTGETALKEKSPKQSSFGEKGKPIPLAVWASVVRNQK